ncbi:MAG TPA: hypothetical protein VKM93_02340 [Terriglobia bacterium]|nr:hypothetical protein [Terriglobia bacterium]
MKLLPLFLAGFAAGLAVCWAYIRRLTATIKLYETYIHERIDAMAKHDATDENPAAASSCTQTAKVASSR